MIRETADGVEIAVRVVPRARKNEIAGRRGDALLVRLAAPPLDGAANAALVGYLARQLGVATRAVRIVSGERSRDKRVRVSGLSADALLRTLNLPASG
jgi:uncharacterized protein (TIGR00251 family)